MIHSPPVPLFVFLSSCTAIPLVWGGGWVGGRGGGRISPQWLSELRHLGRVFPDELRVNSFSQKGSHTLPG